MKDDGSGDLILKVDASGHGLGAVLSVTTDSGEKPVTFISRRLTDAEKKYHANELECLGLVWSLGKLRHYLFGRQFVVFTDSNVLRWLTSKRDIPGKFARWILALQEYTFEIRHQNGRDNVVADALSRAPVGRPVENDPTERLVCVLDGPQLPAVELAELQQADPALMPIIAKLQGLIVNSTVSTDGYSLQKGVLYRRLRTREPVKLVLPLSMRQEVLRHCHDELSGGHLGVAKTLARVERRYWWSGITVDVKDYVT